MPPLDLSSTKVISFDAFGTLLDFDGIKLKACPDVMAAEGAEGEEEAFFSHWSRTFLRIFHDSACRDGVFMTIREITREALAEILPSWGGTGDGAEGTEIWFRFLRQVELFPEARELLEQIRDKYRFCIVSDIDDDVLLPVLERIRLPVEMVFTSEASRAYKIHPRKSPFTDLFDKMGVTAAEVVHVGDMESDILGAQRNGIQVVWVNRNSLSFPHTPDYEVSDLRELISVF